MLIKDFKNVYLVARNYVEECCITVDQEGHQVTAFTECKGKMRVTDWGGTSSALEMLSITGHSDTPGIAANLEKAAKWLINDQASDGSWEAAEMQCSEATSAVIYDLYNLKLLTPTKKNKAIKYIQKCYQKGTGYFLSLPNANEVPHIYTTYLAVRSLATYGVLEEKQKQEIINRINETQSSDDNWGPTAKCPEGDVVHTVFALLILYYCGVPVKDIKKKYRKNIKWLRKQIKHLTSIGNAFVYEAIDVYSNQQTDQYGDCAHILKSYHFSLALMCNFFTKIEDYDVSYRLIEKMIKMRGVQDGWGLNSEGRIFVWATQQAIDCMSEFEEKAFSGKTKVGNVIRSLIYKIPYFWIRFLIVIAFVPIFIWLLKDETIIPDVILGIVFLIVPWLIKIQD